MRVLVAHPSRPHLRLLRLPEAELEPVPVPVSARALAGAIRRDGWLAYRQGEAVRGIAWPLAGRGFRVGRWWDCVAALDPRTVWLANPIDPDPSAGIDAPALLVEYDGVRREEVSRRELPEAGRLEAAVPEGLVSRPLDPVGDGVPDVLTLWPWGTEGGVRLAPGHDVLAYRGSLLVVETRDGELALVDAATRTRTPIERPLPGDWNMFGSFSPDGAWFAVGVREQDSGVRNARLLEGLPALPADYDVAGWMTTLLEPVNAPALADVRRRMEEPDRTRLALVNAVTGAVTLAEGRFDNFATTPVWSPDSRRLVFEAPFEKTLYACDLTERPPRLTPVIRGRACPTPLLDVTAATAG